MRVLAKCLYAVKHIGKGLGIGLRVLFKGLGLMVAAALMETGVIPSVVYGLGIGFFIFSATVCSAFGALMDGMYAAKVFLKSAYKSFSGKEAARISDTEDELSGYKNFYTYAMRDSMNEVNQYLKSGCKYLLSYYEAQRDALLDPYKNLPKVTFDDLKATDADLMKAQDDKPAGNDSDNESGNTFVL